MVDVVSDPTDVGAWVGLAGDVIDVAVPFVSGVGEIARGARAINQLVDVADSAHDATKIVDRTDDVFDAAKATQTYRRSSFFYK